MAGDDALARPASVLGMLKLYLVRGAAISVGLRVAGVALSYVANVMLSRLLGLHGYGIYAIALGWTLVLTIPARAGFENSALRYVTIYFESGKAELLRGFVRTATAAVVIASVLIGAALVFVGLMAIKADRSVIIWAAVLVMPLALLGVFSAMLRSARRIFASQFFDQMVRPSLLIASLGASVVVGGRLSASAALMFTSFAAFGALLFLLAYFRRVFAPAMKKHPDYRAWRHWFALSLPMLLMGSMQELMNQMEVILLGSFADAKQAGLFAAAWRLASFSWFGLSALAAAGGPLIASSYDRNARKELHSVSALVARLGLAFALAAALVLGLGGRHLLGLFGPEFPAAYPVLLILLLGGIANAFTGIVAYLLTLTGRERPALVIFGGALVVSAGLNLLLIPRFGAIGAASASSSATAAWNFAMLIYVRRTMGIDASAVALSPVET